MAHQTGHPLSDAERRQRRNAALARWGALFGGTTAGAVIGAETGRHAIAMAAPRVMADRLAEHQAGFDARTAQRRNAINEAVTRRMRVRPDPTHPNVPVMGGAEPPRGQAPRIYAYQIAALERQLKRVSDPAKAGPIRGQITRLRQLNGTAPQPTARRGTRRFTSRQAGEARLAALDKEIAAFDLFGLEADPKLKETRAQIEREINEAFPVDVNAHVMRAHRGGETTPQIERRIANAKTELRHHRDRVLTPLFERRTALLGPSTRARVVNETEALLQQHMTRAGGRGAAIGAAIGLTAAGLGLLAQHIASARGQKKLAKAAKKTPEQSMAANLAQTYRQWIDRLLGKSDTPINFGDDLVHALGPGLTQAYANAATQPPTGQPEGADPRYWINTDFDHINPVVRRHMAEYALDRIVEISNQQREAIRKTLMDQSVMQGIGPRDVARTIRQSIGLTAYQTEVVARYRDELENLDSKALERKLRDKRYDRTVQKAIDTDTPLKPEQINAMVDAYHRRMLALRAETIARTESIRATSYGAVARAQDVLDSHPNLDCIKHWIATDDDRTRDTHRHLNGQEVQGIQAAFETTAGNRIRWPVDQEAVADETINCLLPGTRVFAPELLAMSRREFDGEIITFETADGSKLSCTINHPILTDTGWTAAQFLKEGDRIVCGDRGDWTAKIDDDQERHPRIEDVEYALRFAGGSVATKIGVGVDFHGEGIGGQIDVAIADYDLVSAYDAACRQHVAESAFGGADLVADTLSRSGRLGPPLSRFLAPTDVGVSGGDLRLALALRHLRPFQSLSLTAAPNSAAIFAQDATDDVAGHPVLKGELVDRSAVVIGREQFVQSRSFAPTIGTRGGRSACHTGGADISQNSGARNADLLTDLLKSQSGLVKLQQVIYIGRRKWSGHVYNLETASGLYIAENTVNHNCRCSLGFRFIPKQTSLRATAA
jgi:Phage Mu protein F like protein